MVRKCFQTGFEWFRDGLARLKVVSESGQKVVSDWFQVVLGRPSAAESGFRLVSSGFGTA